MVMVGYSNMFEKTAQAIESDGYCIRAIWQRWVLKGISTTWVGSSTRSFAAVKISFQLRSRNSWSAIHIYNMMN